MSSLSRVFSVVGIVVLVGLSLASVGFVNADCVGKKDVYGYELCAEKITFSDVSISPYKNAIEYAQRNRIVKGYADGSFKPDAPVNRAEFTKILVEAVLGETPVFPNVPCFPDVQSGIWFEPYVCYGKNKLFNGYPDGNFGPGNNINLAEASKILANTFHISIPNTVEEEMWYGPFVQSLADKKALPGTIPTAFHAVTRGEMVEMIMRLKENITNSPSLTGCDFVPERCEENPLVGYWDEFMENIDMTKVRSQWLSWYNQARADNGLGVYVYNNELNRSAYTWSQFSNQRGEISHKRPGQTAYYDYNIIQQWFANLGIEFKNVSGVTFTENIGYGPYSCNSADCTDQLINSIRSTFDFFMSEKNKSYRPHYNSVMNQYFTSIGLGISIDPNKKQYYLTVHYAVDVL